MEKKKYEKPQISREQLERELLDANERLWLANKKLQQEERMRTEFLSNLSHDLRSPLTAIFGSVEYLKTGDVPQKEQEEVLELMSRRLRSMQTLINDIFLLSKLESSEQNMQPQKIDAGMFLEEFFYDCEADAKYDDRELRLSLSEETHAINIDPESFLRVLDNLFTNALKYSDSGSFIELCSEYKAVDAADKDSLGTSCLLEITVADNGIGIRPEDLEHIFERSYRASKSRTTGDSSSGLGLAIAKSIVEKHGGSIRCESRLGEGSRFIITIPAE